MGTKEFQILVIDLFFISAQYQGQLFLHELFTHELEKFNVADPLISELEIFSI